MPRLRVSNRDAEGYDGVRAPRDHQKFMNAQSSTEPGKVAHSACRVVEPARP